MKKIFQDIIDICEANKHLDTEDTLSDIQVKAKSRVIKCEWEEKYGIKMSKYFRPAENDYYNMYNDQSISYFKDGYDCYKKSYGRSISWSEGDKQPVDEWIYSIGFSTGPYIFGMDYDGQEKLFREFFEELRTYKPDYEDLHNRHLYWKIENAKTIMDKFMEILNKYHAKNNDELKSREIAKLEARLSEIKKEAGLIKNNMKHPLDGQVKEIAFKAIPGYKYNPNSERTQSEKEDIFAIRTGGLSRSNVKDGKEVFNRQLEMSKKRRHYFVYLVYSQTDFELACPSKIKRAVIRVISFILPRVLKVKIVN